MIIVNNQMPATVAWSVSSCRHLHRRKNCRSLLLIMCHFGLQTVNIHKRTHCERVYNIRWNVWIYTWRQKAPASSLYELSCLRAPHSLTPFDFWKKKRRGMIDAVRLSVTRTCKIARTRTLITTTPNAHIIIIFLLKTVQRYFPLVWSFGLYIVNVRNWSFVF